MYLFKKYNINKSILKIIKYYNIESYTRFNKGKYSEPLTN